MRVMKPVLATMVMLVAVASVTFLYGAVLKVGLTVESADTSISLELGVAV